MNTRLQRSARFFGSVRNSFNFDLHECYKAFKKLPRQCQAALSLFALVNLLPEVQATNNDRVYFQDPTNTTTYELLQTDLPNQNFTKAITGALVHCNATVINYMGNASFNLINGITQPLANVVPTDGVDFMRMVDNKACTEFETCLANFIADQPFDNPSMSHGLLALGGLILFLWACDKYFGCSSGHCSGEAYEAIPDEPRGPRAV